MPAQAETPLPRLLLASGSPYRARLLARLGLPFDVVATGIDEHIPSDEHAADAAQRLARAKALSVNSQHANTLVIGSDQVAACQGRLLGKPGSAQRAAEQLAFCAGREVTFYTGLALWHPDSNRVLEHVVEVTVRLRMLSEREIASYIKKDDPLDCAGSFKWEQLGISLFEWMRTDDPTALEGLPLITLCRDLRSFGFALP